MSAPGSLSSSSSRIAAAPSNGERGATSSRPAPLPPTTGRPTCGALEMRRRLARGAAGTPPGAAAPLQQRV